jgi:hypothetical protein
MDQSVFTGGQISLPCRSTASTHKYPVRRFAMSQAACPKSADTAQAQSKFILLTIRRHSS